MKNRDHVKRAVKTLIVLYIHLGDAPVTSITLTDVIITIFEMAEASGIEAQALIDECIMDLYKLNEQSATRSVLENFQPTTRPN